nr:MULTISPECIES: FAD-dependent oxidoreductase [Spiroplasma]
MVRYRVIYKNNFINSPVLLQPTLQLKTNPHIFFAGQITGVEGYVESAAMGLESAINIFSLYYPARTAWISARNNDWFVN